MRNICFIITLFLLAGLSLFTSSCNDFLEKPFSITFNEDSAFANYQNVQKLVNDLYANQVYYTNSGTGGFRLSGSNLDACTDLGSGFRLQAAYGAHKFNDGTVTAEWLSDNAGGEDVYQNHYSSIRKGFALLERIDEVPDATSQQKERIKAEAKTMIAFEYFELVKRYGGVPLIKKRLSIDDDYKIGRATLKEVYDYIFTMLNEAIATEAFPARTDGPEYSRMNKAFAYSIRARAALYMASPLYNADKPYMESLGDQSDRIFLGSFDPARWDNAFKYADEAIKFCEANGYAIVNSFDVFTNYTVAFRDKPSAGNTEIIYATQKSGSPNEQYWSPRGTPISGYSPNLPTMNLIEKYSNRDGTKVNWDAGITTPANQPTYPYDKLDPRFQQSIFYHGQLYYPTTGYRLEFFDHETNPALNGNQGRAKSASQFGHVFSKFYYGYQDRRYTQKTWELPCPIMRLAEVYLIYAEALNEFLSVPDQRIYDKLNAIRSRSGMPDITPGLTKVQMREAIRDERAVELIFEEHRFWDLKRWKMGEVFKGPVYDVRTIKKNDNTYTYTKYKYEDRVWFNHYYLHPFPPTEINKLYGLIQNPGW